MNLLLLLFLFKVVWLVLFFPPSGNTVFFNLKKFLLGFWLRLQIKEQILFSRSIIDFSIYSNLVFVVLSLSLFFFCTYPFQFLPILFICKQIFKKIHISQQVIARSLEKLLTFNTYCYDSFSIKSLEFSRQKYHLQIKANFLLLFNMLLTISVCLTTELFQHNFKEQY